MKKAFCPNKVNIKRPVLWLLFIYLFFFILVYRGKPPGQEGQHPVLSSLLQGSDEGIDVKLSGKLVKENASGNGFRIVLKQVDLCAVQHNVHCGYILLYSDRQTKAVPGDTIYSSGRLSEFQEPDNPGQFSMKKYYYSQGIYYSCQVKNLQVKKTHHLWEEWLWKLKKSLMRVYDTWLDEKDSGTIKAMILGDKENLYDEISYLYQATGISHILAISGLHVSLVGMSIFSLLKLAGCPVFPNCLVSAIIMLSFLKLTGEAVSTKRAVIMLFILLLSYLCKRSYDTLSAWSVSVLIIFWSTPFAYYGSGFLLSFGAVLGIAVVTPALQKIFGETPEKTIRLNERLTREKRECRQNHRPFSLFIVKLKFGRYFRNLFLGSVGVQLTILPVLASVNYKIPVYSVFLNLFILPFVSFLLLVAFYGGLSGVICLSFGSVLTIPVHSILSWYEKIANLFYRLPYHTILTGKPEVWKIIIYYGSLLYFLWVVGREKRPCFRHMLYLIPLVVIFFPVGHGELEITALSVGQGDGIVIYTPEKKTILIDGGSSSIAGVGQYRLEPFLYSKGCKTIDSIIVTHGDDDHISGVRELLEQSDSEGIRVSCLYLPDIKNGDEACEKLKKTAEIHGVAVKHLYGGKQWKENNLTLTCLFPEKNMTVSDRNDASVVCYLEYGNYDFLFTGDLPESQENQVLSYLKKYTDYDGGGISVLKVAHHGSKYSTGKKWLDTLKPEYAVISCGRKNRYGHPHEELLNRLKEAGVKVLRTDELGAIEVKIKGGEMMIAGYCK